jgi:hypothetical protein
MSARNSVSKALAVILPGGALGASILLALGYSATAATASVVPQPASEESVADRLQAIRLGVSAFSQSSGVDSQSGSAEAPRSDAPLVPTWWGNGGWGRWRFGWGNGGFGWPNWHNWHNWPNGWGNGGWNNWGNGWHNYWHNG